MWRSPCFEYHLKTNASLLHLAGAKHQILNVEVEGGGTPLCTWVERTDELQCHFLCTIHLFLCDTRSFIVLKFTILSRLNGQQAAQDLAVSFSPAVRLHTPQDLAVSSSPAVRLHTLSIVPGLFPCGFCVVNSTLRTYKANTSLTELSSQSCAKCHSKHVPTKL